MFDNLFKLKPKQERLSNVPNIEKGFEVEDLENQIEVQQKIQATAERVGIKYEDLNETIEKHGGLEKVFRHLNAPTWEYPDVNYATRMMFQQSFLKDQFDSLKKTAVPGAIFCWLVTLFAVAVPSFMPESEDVSILAGSLLGISFSALLGTIKSRSAQKIIEHTKAMMELTGVDYESSEEFKNIYK